MPQDLFHLDAVLDAAERILSAREEQMVTSEEWDSLHRAVTVCREPSAEERTEAFAIRDGCLVRTLTGPTGTATECSVPLDVYETVARVMDDVNGTFNTEEVRSESQVTWTQAAAVLHLLARRGVIRAVEGGQFVMVSPETYAAAISAYHSLRREGSNG